MCTIIAIHGVRSDHPLVLATNRDEFFARPTGGPERLLETPRTVGGRDLVAGGTWMGVTAAGLFVGVTNQRTLQAPDPSKRSRGEIVLRTLALGTTNEVTRFVRTLDARQYNAFNLMWGEAGALFVGYARTDARDVHIVEVPPGLHVLPNDVLDSDDFVKVRRAKEIVTPALHAPFGQLVTALEAALSDRQLPTREELGQPGSMEGIDPERLRRLAALCVRTDEYGTRSSTISSLQPGRVAHYTYADGPPGQTPFVDVRGLF